MNIQQIQLQQQQLLNNKLRSGAYVRVLKESGFYEALFGLSLSFDIISQEVITGETTLLSNEKFIKMQKVAETLAFKSGGHNKFLESIQVWLLVRGSLSFWKQFDIYRCGITKQSESTMHTLKKRVLTEKDFTKETYCIPAIHGNMTIDEMRDNLPSGFLETRLVNTNYKTLQNVIYQRQNHKSQRWNTFIEMLLKQVQHPEYLIQTN